METTKFNQTFYQAEADAMFSAGCKCTSTNGGGDCDWCRVYYGGPGEATVPCLGCSKPVPYNEGTCQHCGYKEF